MTTLDERDRRLLDIIQAGFPIAPRPYQVLAEMVGSTEEDVLARVKRLADDGVIRHIGPVFNLPQLGGVSTLCAARIAREYLDAAIAAVNRYREVTHNYLRDHDFNVWFTLVASAPGRIEQILGEIRALPGVHEVISLPAEKTFKINVHFHTVEE